MAGFCQRCPAGGVMIFTGWTGCPYVARKRFPVSGFPPVVSSGGYFPDGIVAGRFVGGWARFIPAAGEFPVFQPYLCGFRAVFALFYSSRFLISPCQGRFSAGNFRMAGDVFPFDCRHADCRVAFLPLACITLFMIFHSGCLRCFPQDFSPRLIRHKKTGY